MPKFSVFHIFILLIEKIEMQAIEPKNETDAPGTPNFKEEPERIDCIERPTFTDAV